MFTYMGVLQKELIKKRIYPARAQAKSENFENIEAFTTEESPVGKRMRPRKYIS